MMAGLSDARFRVRHYRRPGPYSVEYDEQQAGQLLPHVSQQEVVRAVTRVNRLTHIAPDRVRCLCLLYVLLQCGTLAVMMLAAFYSLADRGAAPRVLLLMTLPLPILLALLLIHCSSKLNDLRFAQLISAAQAEAEVFGWRQPAVAVWVEQIEPGRLPGRCLDSIIDYEFCMRVQL